MSLLPQSLYWIASLLTSDVLDSGRLRIQDVDQIHAFSQGVATTSYLRTHTINVSDSLITMRNMDSLTLKYSLPLLHSQYQFNRSVIMLTLHFRH